MALPETELLFSLPPNNNLNVFNWKVVKNLTFSQTQSDDLLGTADVIVVVYRGPQGHIMSRSVCGIRNVLTFEVLLCFLFVGCCATLKLVEKARKREMLHRHRFWI